MLLPTACILWPRSVLLRIDPHDDQKRRHDEYRIRHAEQGAPERDFGERARNANRDRKGAVGEAQSGQHRADADRRDDGVDPDLGDEKAVDEADDDSDQKRERDAHWDRQALLGHEAGDDEADEACDIADAEIELADHQREGEARRDDRGQRRLTEDVEEIRPR